MLLSTAANEVPTRSLTDDFTDGLRQAILAGRKAPGARLPLESLKEEFEVSLSPIREGLARLVTEGLVVAVGQRGYKVAPVSIDELIEARDLRIDLETKGLRAAMKHGDEQWELRVMTSYQRLKNFEAKRWMADELDGWELRHHEFHEALISACNAPLLMRFCRILHGMSDRYRRVVLSAQEPDRDVRAEHAEIFEAVLARDEARACEALRKHIDRTAQTVLQVMQAQQPERGARRK